MAPESSIQFITFGKRQAPSEWTFKHYPYVNRLYYISGGTGFYTGGGMRHRLQPGYLYLFPADLAFAAEQHPTDRLDHLYFDFSIVPPLLVSKFIEFKVDDDSVPYHIIKALELYVNEDQIAGKRTRNEVVVGMLFGGLLNIICQECGIKRLNDPRMNEVLAYIHQRYQEELSNQQLADLLHVDKRHFMRIFKQTMQMTPNRYIREYRLNMAESLLRIYVPVHEVAEQVGYESSASFYQAYKKSRGMSPSDYARRNER